MRRANMSPQMPALSQGNAINQDRKFKWTQTFLKN